MVSLLRLFISVSPMISAITLLPSLVSSQTFIPQSPSHLPLPTHLLYQFPNPTWIENIALRTTTGDLLLTLASTPSLYLLDPISLSAPPILIHTFTDVQALLGITEQPPSSDIFYLATANITTSTISAIPHTGSIYRIDLRSYNPHSKTPLLASRVKKIASIPEASLLNGLTSLPNSNTILIADSGFGLIYALFPTTGKYKVYLNTTETLPPAPPGLAFGVNGLKIRDGYLYFTNSGRQTFNRVRIGFGGFPEGQVQVLASVFGDDFCFDKRGRAWVAENAINTVSVVEDVGGKGGWKVTVVAGSIGSLEVAGGTACVFGKRDWKEENEETLYLVTTGGLLAPVNGTVVEGGKLVAIETRDYQRY